MGASAKDQEQGPAPVWNIPELERVSFEEAASAWGCVPKGVSLGGLGMVTAPATASSCCFPFSQRCAVATSPGKTRGGAVHVGRSPQASSSAHLMPRSGLPHAMHFPCSMQVLSAPRLPQATALASTPGWAAAVASHWRGPTLGEGRGWAEKREWNSFFSRSFTRVLRALPLGLGQMAAGWWILPPAGHWL